MQDHNVLAGHAAAARRDGAAGEEGVDEARAVGARRHTDRRRRHVVSDLSIYGDQATFIFEIAFIS